VTAIGIAGSRLSALGDLNALSVGVATRARAKSLRLFVFPEPPVVRRLRERRYGNGGLRERRYGGYRKRRFYGGYGGGYNNGRSGRGVIMTIEPRPGGCSRPQVPQS